MKKKIIIYGIISGLIVSAQMLLAVNYMSHCNGNLDFNTSMLLGYTSMLIAFSLVFIGIRKYRNEYNHGIISFGKAFQIGITIVCISSLFYVVTWLVNFYFFIPDFMEKYSAHILEELKKSGASAAEIKKQTKEMADFAIQYKNPFFNAMVTFAEIFPVGLLVTIISAILLKRKQAATTN